MAVSKQQKHDLIIKFGGNEQNTGKTEVQIAILSAEIASLTTHMIENKKDKTSKRGLYKKVAQRKKLLSYLMKTDIERYREIIKELNLRG